MILYNSKEQNKELNKKDIRAINSLLTKIDRIISGRLNLEVRDGSGELGRNIKGTQSGNKLLFNYKNIQTDLREHELSTHLYLILKGINFHELSHYLYTDLNKKQVNEKFKKEEWTEKEKYQYRTQKFLLILNELEDTRIENMFIEKYNKSKDYFKYLSLGLKFDFMWITAYGRKNILPPTLLRKVKAKKLNNYTKEQINKLSELIDEYITTINPDELYEIAKEVFKIMVNSDVKLPREGNTGLNSLKKKKRYQEGKRAKENINKKVKKKNKKLTNEDIKIDSEEIGEGDLKAELEEEKDSLEKQTKEELSKEVDNEIKEAKKKSKGYGIGQSNLRGQKKVKFRETNSCKTVKNDLVKKLRNIRIAFSPYYKRKKKKGKIDIREAMNFLRTGTTRVFREYKRDKRDETNLALLLALDNSGSMGGNRSGIARRTCWIINEALKEIGGDVELYMWSSERHKENIKVLKSFNSGFRYVFPKARGGTKPTKAMELAMDSFEHYSSISDKEKVFVLFTDGQFNSEHTIEPLRKMRNMEIHNLGIALKTYRSDKSGINEFNNQKVISSIKDLPEVISSFLVNVEEKVKKQLNR